MEINENNIKAAYEEATESEKRLLSNLFPELLLGRKDVTERIKTFEDACRELGGNHSLVKEWTINNSIIESPDLKAYMKLRIICAALNEGWEPQFKINEERWFPWYYLWTEREIREDSDERHMIIIGDKYQSEYTSLVCTSDYLSVCTSVYIPFNLCLKSEALAEYCGKQFIDLWADFMLIPKNLS